MKTASEDSSRLKYMPVDRAQLGWEILDLENLITADHPARIIWEVSGRLDLRGFEAESKSVEGSAGRPAWPPQLMVSVWVYGDSIGVASARAIERLMEHEPGLRWLTANQVINYHTLADFRGGREKALEDLFVQLLGLLNQAGVVDLNTILVDGTKVRTVAGRESLHRRKTLEKHLRAARKVVRELDRRAKEEPEGMEKRREAAQRRAARETVERVESALAKLTEKEKKTPSRERADLRASESEAEAGKMKQPDGGWAPSYNVQVSTEAKSRVIVSVGVTEAKNDTHQLLPALEKVKKNCGGLPPKVIADGGYATRENVEQTSAQGIELIAPWKEEASREAGALVRNGIAAEFGPSAFRAERGGPALICPAGKKLVMIQQRIHHELPRNVFQARERDCVKCRFRTQCCGKRGAPRRVERIVETPAMRKYLARMKRPDTRALYKKRAEIAEFPHLWFKTLQKWRRFSVRGLVKAGTEALWVALAYNVAQWIRVRTAVPTAA
jgi:transposase